MTERPATHEPRTAEQVRASQWEPHSPWLVPVEITEDPLPGAVKASPEHNTYVLALIQAIARAATPESEHAAVVDLDPSKTPWWLLIRTNEFGVPRWQVWRRTAQRWERAVAFTESIDRAADVMRRCDQRYGIHDENPPLHPTTADEAANLRDLARAAALGFVREPTIGGDEAYRSYEAIDAEEAREWIDAIGNPPEPQGPQLP